VIIPEGEGAAVARKKKPEAFVLDGSVALAWSLGDEQNAYADAVAKQLKSAEAVVPALWPFEVVNVLVVGERRRRCTPAQLTKAMTFLRSVKVRIDWDSPVRAWTDTFVLARAHNLTAYDASYLEVAVRHGLPLATLDVPLRSAAAAAGVPIYLAP
jgi:predicted nucleic acid-binding protein